MIVGLVGEAVVIAEDFRPLIPPLFLSPDNTYTRGQKCMSFRTTQPSLKKTNLSNTSEVKIQHNASNTTCRCTLKKEY